MVKESSGYNTNKIYLSFEDYIGLFNLFSKIISIKTLDNVSVNLSYIIKNQLKRIECDCDEVISNTFNTNKQFRHIKCNTGIYRQFVNEDLLITVVLCKVADEYKDKEYLHPITNLVRPIFSDDYDHIYVFIDDRMCYNDNFIKEINKVNNEEEIFSQDYNKNLYPISSRADYFNKIMDNIMSKVCRGCDGYTYEIIKEYDAALSYTLYSDGDRFKDDDKKKINSVIDQILSTADANSEYLLIADKENAKYILESNFKK